MKIITFNMKLPFFLMIFFLTTILNAQIDSTAFYKITSLENIPQNDVNCIFKDSKGFMWLGTLDGLHRFDGYSYKTYRTNTNAKNSISSNMIIEIDEDSQGNLWIGTYGRGLCKFNPETEQFTEFSSKNKKLSGAFNDDMSCMMVDDHDYIWLGNWFNITRIKLDDKMEEIVESVSISIETNNVTENQDVKTFHQDKEGQIWFGTNFQLIRVVNPYSDLSKIEYERFNCHTTTIVDFEDGVLAGGANISAVQKNIVTGKYEMTVLLETASLALLYKNQQIWNGNRLGVSCYQYNPIRGWQIKQRFNKNWSDYSLNSNLATSLVEDDLAQIWLGTRGGGVNIISQEAKKFKKFKHTREKGSLANNIVKAVFEDHRRNLWIGTEERGVSVLPFKEKENYLNGFTHITVSELLNYNRVYAIEESFTPKSKKQKSIVWLGTNSPFFLLAIDPVSFEQIELPDFVSTFGFVFSIKAQNDSTLWLGTYGQGLWRLGLDDNGNIKSYDNFRPDNKNGSKISSFIIRNIFIDKDGNIWISTDKGLNVIEKNQSLKPNPDINIFYSGTGANDLPHDYLLQIIQGSDGTMWIGSMGGGLIKAVKNEKGDWAFSSVTVEDGLPNNSVKSIMEDKHGNLWLASNNGLSKYNPKDSTVINYDESDGLQDNEFGEIAACKRSNGQFIFGGINGFNVFYPEQIVNDIVKPKMFLTDFYILNKKISTQEEVNGRILLEKSIEETEELELKYEENSFSFGFVGLHYNTPKRNSYKYKLEGFDKNWVNASAEYRIANYTNIPPGEYTFMVLGANSDNIWCDEPLKMKVIVRQPLLKSLVAKIIYVILLIIILYFTYKVLKTFALRKKEALVANLEKENIEALSQMRLRFFTNISHEFRTPLTLINAPLDKLIKKDNELTDKEREKNHNLIKQNVNVLLRLVNQLLDFRKLEQGKLKLKPELLDLNMFLKEIFSAFYSLAEQKEVNFIYEDSQQEIFISFDREKIEKVIYNLLSNAFKFTPRHGEIKIKVWKKETEDIAVISVADTGSGISEEAQKHIFERYYQSDSHGAKSIGGTGIGLALSKGLIELHNGTLTFESEVGEGTIFYVHLPFKQDIIADMELHTQNQYLVSHESKEKKQEASNDSEKVSELSSFDKQNKILIVEDNVELRKVVAELFENNFTIFEADDGVEGLKLCKDQMPDLVISDIMMPNMDGIEMCSIIKSDEEISHIPIILLTAKNTVESQVEGFQMGADSYVSKPFSPDVLIARVISLIKQREKLRQKFQKEIEINPMIIANSPTDTKFLEKILAIIEENMSDSEFNVEKLADIYGVSRIYLNRKIKALTGETSNKFLRNIRLKHAAELLKQNVLTVSEVTWQVGYNDLRTFRQRFKEKFGASPSEFAKNND